MSKFFWKLLVFIVAVAISAIQAATKKKVLEKSADKKKEAKPLSQATKDLSNLKGRAIYEGFLTRMYPRGGEKVSDSKEVIPDDIVAGPVASDVEPEREPVSKVMVKKSVLKNKQKKERPTTPLVEFNNPAAIIQGIIFSEALSQPKAKNKFRYR